MRYQPQNGVVCCIYPISNNSYLINALFALLNLNIVAQSAIQHIYAWATDQHIIARTTN